MIKDERLFIKFFLKLKLSQKNLNISWWRCKLSGLRGDIFVLSFLIIENKFSKHGYQISKIIKNGDKKGFST